MPFARPQKVKLKGGNGGGKVWDVAGDGIAGWFGGELERRRYLKGSALFVPK